MAQTRSAAKKHARGQQEARRAAVDAARQSGAPRPPKRPSPTDVLVLNVKPRRILKFVFKRKDLYEKLKDLYKKSKDQGEKPADLNAKPRTPAAATKVLHEPPRPVGGLILRNGNKRTFFYPTKIVKTNLNGMTRVHHFGSNHCIIEDRPSIEKD